MILEGGYHESLDFILHFGPRHRRGVLPNPRLALGRQAGGEGSDYGYGIAADAAGNACICGLFTADAAFGPLTLTSAGNLDICVAKWKPEK